MDANNLTKTEKYLYEKIEKDRINFSKYTLKQISQNYFVSQTVVLKLMKKLNFSSLKEMQIYFYNENEIENFTEINGDFFSSNTQGVIDNTFAKSLYGLIMTKKKNDAKVFEKIKLMILKSKSIIFFGVGNSHNIAKILSDSLHKIGFNTYIYNSTKEVLISLEFCDPLNTIFIFYTSSGTTYEVTFLANKVNEKGIEFILVTSDKSKFRENALSKAKCVFEYTISAKEFYAFPLVSALFCQSIFNIILLNLLISEQKGFIEKMESATKSLNKWSESNRE